MNVLSTLDDALDAITDSANNFLDDVVPASLLPNVDFDSLLADMTDIVNDAFSDTTQIIEASTDLVVSRLDSLAIEADVVDVSDIVQEVVNFVANLPEDATIADALDEIVDFFDVALPSLSDDELLELLDDVSELIDEIAPNLSQLSITPTLTQGIEFVEDVLDSVGTITVDGSSLSGELTLDGEPFSFETDLSDEVSDLLGDVGDFLSGISGSASLNDGQFTGDITLAGSDYALSLDITEALTDGLTSLLSAAEVTLPFTNGVVAIDIATALGGIEGTVDFAGGALDLDLLTPFGEVDTSFEFPEDTQFSIPAIVPGGPEFELDLADGVLRLPIPNVPSVEIPLNAFSGELGLSDGVATLMVGDFGGFALDDIETTFEIGPIASEVAIALTEDLTGDITIEAGEIMGTVVTDFGEFDLTASLNDLVLQASAIIDQTTGTLSLDSGLASIDFDTPFGEISGGLALDAIEDALADASNALA